MGHLRCGWRWQGDPGSCCQPVVGGVSTQSYHVSSAWGGAGITPALQLGQLLPTHKPGPVPMGVTVEESPLSPLALLTFPTHSKHVSGHQCCLWVEGRDWLRGGWSVTYTVSICIRQR